MVRRLAAVEEVEAALLRSGRLIDGRCCSQCQGDYPTFLDVEPPTCVACLTESSGLPFRSVEPGENAET